MKATESALLYHTHPVVSELNRVPGFDPLRFLKKTPNGPVLELKYKKLWFRLKYPQGRFKLSALKITDQLAIIEARVYFDKNDTEPKASFTARSDIGTAPGGMYIEAAQYAAIDQALTDAGFGIQFVADRSDAQTAAVPEIATASSAEKPAAGTKTVPLTETEQPKENAREDTPPKLKVVSQPAAGEELPAEQAAAAPSVSADGYTNDMSVEEICARMTLAEAENYIVPLGTCNGQTMLQVADRRPASLRYYMTGYNGDNNILRAAATLVANSRSQQQAG